MKEIEVEHTHYIYLSGVDNILETRKLELDIVGFEPSMSKQIMDNSDIRMVIIKGFETKVGYVYYLHWDDESDLRSLDDKVEKGVFTNIDFKYAIKTLYDIVKCINNHTWEVLVVPSGDPYLGNPGLMEKKIADRGNRNGFKMCPLCKASLRQMVVKIFFEDKTNSLNNS